MSDPRTDRILLDIICHKGITDPAGQDESQLAITPLLVSPGAFENLFTVHGLNTGRNTQSHQQRLLSRFVAFRPGAKLSRDPAGADHPQHDRFTVAVGLVIGGRFDGVTDRVTIVEDYLQSETDLFLSEISMLLVRSPY